MTLRGTDAAVADMLIGVDTLWGGDVTNPSGTGRFIADCWFSDEPLPKAYTHDTAGGLREMAVRREVTRRAAVDAYLAEVDVRGAIARVLADSRSIGGLRGRSPGGPRSCIEVMWDLAMEMVGKGAGALRALRANVNGGSEPSPRRRVGAWPSC